MSMDTSFLVFVGAMVGPPLGVGWAMIRLHRGWFNGADMRIGRPEALLVESLESGLGATRVGPRQWTLDRGAGPWTWTFAPGGDGPSKVTVSQRLPVCDAPDAHPEHPRMRFSLETPLHRLGKRLGVSREMQLGDAEFDATVYVESDPDCPFSRAVLERAATRRQVARLVRRGVRGVGTGQQEGEVYGTLWQHADWGEPDQLAAWQDALDAFVATLPPARAVPAPPSPWRSRELVAVASIPAILGAIFFAGHAHDVWRPLSDGLWASGVAVFAVLWTAYAWGALRWSGQRPTGILDLGVVLCTGWMGVVPLAAGGVLMANGLGDPMVDQRLPVIAHRADSNADGDPIQLLVVQPPPGSTTPLTRRVSPQRLASTPVGTDCIVSTGRGRLGVPWLAGISCL